MINSNNKYLVATRCMTYNQKAYIEDALRGFAMQDTTFPIVFIIVDDASTDGEQELLKRWVENNLKKEEGVSIWEKLPYGNLASSTLIGKPLSHFIVLLLNENYYQTGRDSQKREYIKKWFEDAKYNAFCEGDDYWVNQNKLQMQVDFMESHPDYVLCHTDFDLTSGKPRNHRFKIAKNDEYFPQCIIEGIHIGTATSLYRLDAYNKRPRMNVGKNWPMGDYPMWIELLHEGKAKYMPIVTAHYREVENSFSHGSLQKELSFAKAVLDIRKFYAEYYGLDLPNGGLSKDYYLTVMKCAYKYKSKHEAKKCFKEAAANKMLSIKLLFFLSATYSRIINKMLRYFWS